MPAHFDDVLADIRARDERDSEPRRAPLKPAADAIVLDTSELDVGSRIAEAIRLAEERLGDAENCHRGRIIFTSACDMPIVGK